MNPATPGVPGLIRVLLALQVLVAMHLAWAGLTVTRSLLHLTEAGMPISLPHLDRAAVVGHVHACWIALAIVLNAAWLLWRGLRSAGPLNLAAGLVLLYLYFDRTLWPFWASTFPGCVAVPVVAALGLVQLTAPMSPAWPGEHTCRRLGGLDVTVILLLTVLPVFLGQMIVVAAQRDWVRTLEEDPEVILAELTVEEALERAETLVAPRPDVARAIAERLTRSEFAPVRARAWRLLAPPALGVSSVQLAAGLTEEPVLGVRFARYEALRARGDADADAALARVAESDSIEERVALARALAVPDGVAGAPLRTALARSLTALRIAEQMPDDAYRLAYARAGRPELEGILVALEAAPAGQIVADSACEATLRWLWETAVRKGPEWARAGIPSAARVPPRLRALVLGDLVPWVGRDRLAAHWRDLATLFQDADATVREAAGYALYRLQAPASSAALAEALEDPDPGVRLWVAMAWTEMKGTPPAGVFEAIFRDELSPDRYDAAVFLLKYGKHTAGVPYLIEQLRTGGRVGAMTRTVLHQAFNVDLGSDADAWQHWWQENRERVQRD